MNTMRRYFENVSVWARGAQTLNKKKKGTLGSCGLPGRRAGVQGAGRGPGGDIRLGNEASAMVAGSRESGAGVAGSEIGPGLKSRPRKVGPGGQSRGPHPGLDVLGPAGVGQGVPGLLEGTARWADVRNHHGAAVPPEGILGGRGVAVVRWGHPPSRHLSWVTSFLLCLSLSHTYTHSQVLSPGFLSSSPTPTHPASSSFSKF